MHVRGLGLDSGWERERREERGEMNCAAGVVDTARDM